MDERSLTMRWLEGRYAVCRLKPEEATPQWAEQAAGLLSITRTATELSIVARDELVPLSVTAERGWSAMEVVGPLDFSLVGILARLTAALAEAKVPVFAISTYDTDVLLVKAEHVSRAEAALRNAGMSWVER